MIVMERKNHQEVVLPPYTTCKLCRNNMNQACVEACAPARDYRNFELKKGIELVDMPDFPYQDFVGEMLPRVRTIVIGVYISKIMTYLKGAENGRENFDGSGSSNLLEALQKQGLRHDTVQKDAPREDRKERPGEGDRPEKVD